MNKKIALQGFSRLKLFPVLKNGTTEYAVGEGFELPNAQSMTKETDATENKIYADDVLYLNMKSWNGMNATITLAEMTLEMLGKLGFGEYDDATATLKWNPQGINKEFACSYRCLMASGQYRMMKMFSFIVNEVKETGTNTKGSGGEINAYQLIGTFTARKCDDLPGEIHDGDDMDWLDTIEEVTAE